MDICKIVDVVEMYARVLSDVLHADIGISDMVPRYIAGTGPLRGKVGMDLEKEGHVLRSVMGTKEAQIIPRPRHHTLCEGCLHRNICQESLEIAYPILTEDAQLLGVISIICFTEEQRQHILSAQEAYLALLKTISDLIALRAMQAGEGAVQQAAGAITSDFNLEHMERETILRAMQVFDGDKRLVAQKLGIGIATLYRKLNKYGMDIA